MPDTLRKVNARLTWALALAKRGRPVIGISPGEKVPFPGAWEETCDPDIIAARFDTNPEMNIATLGGEHGVILDLDVKDGKNGIEALGLLELQNAILPKTLTIGTPTGGRHLYFKVPYPVTNAHHFGKDAGIDVRGHRGYGLVPGSALPNGIYTVEVNVEIADASDWLLPYLTSAAGEKPVQHDLPEADRDSPENEDRAVSYLLARPPAIQGEHGDEQTYVTAAALGDLGISEDRAFDLMVEHYNPRCEPEWEPDELREKVRSGYANRSQPLGSKAAVLMAKLDAETAPAAQEPSRGEHPTAPPVDSTIPDDGAEKHAADEEKAIESYGFRLFDNYSTDKPPEWLLEGLLPRIGVGIISGGKGTYKTAVTLDLGLSIVARQPFAAGDGEKGFAYVERPDDKRPVVVHVAGEGRGDIETVRAPAWVEQHKVERPVYHVIGKKFPRPDRPDAVRQFIAALKRSIPEDGRLAMVVFDTTARLMRGLDENSARDAGYVIDLADKLVEECNCFVALIHHTNAQGTRHRGSTVLEDDPGVSIKLDKVEGTVTISNAFQREGHEAKPFKMRARPVTVETSSGPRHTFVLDRVRDRDGHDPVTPNPSWTDHGRNRRSCKSS